MSSIFSNRINSSFFRRLKKAKEYTGDYFTPRLMDYWQLCYQTSKPKNGARKVLNAFARMDYDYLMNCIIEHLSIHLREKQLAITPKPFESITYCISYISLIDFGQMILERFMLIKRVVKELPVEPDKTFDHRISEYTDDQQRRLRISFKNVIREMYQFIDKQTLHSLNDGGFWIDGDDTSLLIKLDKYLSMCDDCNKDVCSCEEENPSDPAQASEAFQPLATEITTATISFGAKAQEIAQMLLENGVSQLSDISVLNQSEFESLVQNLKLNTLQLQRLRVASGRP